MATRAGIDASIINRLGASEQNIFFALKAEFDSDDILIWTGTDDLIINSETYNRKLSKQTYNNFFRLCNGWN